MKRLFLQSDLVFTKTKLYIEINPTHFMLILAAFLGGAFRGLIGFVNHKEKTVLLSYVLITLIAEGLFGMFFSLGILYMGLLSATGYLVQMFVVFIAGYVGADIINSLYKILYRKRLEV